MTVKRDFHIKIGKINNKKEKKTKKRKKLIIDSIVLKIMSKEGKPHDRFLKTHNDFFSILLVYKESKRKSLPKCEIKAAGTKIKNKRNNS